MASAVLISAVCLGQVKEVKRAQGIIMGEQPNFEQARAIMQAALTNDETQADANTWYVAGLVGYQENEKLLYAQQLGQAVDMAVRGKAVIESYEYWLKADELAQVLVANKKGELVMDKKNITIRKNIAQKMLNYYEQAELIQYGAELSEKQQYDEAYEAFRRYLAIPDLSMMQDAKMQAKLVKDTTYYLYMYYAARFAYSAGRLDEAIALFDTLKNQTVEQVASGEFLYQCYMDKKDTINANRVLDECIELMPKEPWFIQVRINNLVNAGKLDEAIVYLDKAIERDPQAQYYNSKGSILSQQGKFQTAISVFAKAVEMDPNNAAFRLSYGYAYVDEATRIDEEISKPGVDDKKYAELHAKSMQYRKQALTFFEKAYQMDPTNEEYKSALKRLYYRLNMMDKYNGL